jgi:sarcosine oxidase
VTAAYGTIVVGLGAMGSAAACHLARAGERVLGLERFDLAHDRGSSHGRSRITRQAYFEHPAYVPLLRRATELWLELERDAGVQLLHPTGGLMLGPRDGVLVAGSLASARAHGLPCELLDAAEVERRYPVFALDADMVGVVDPHAGVLFPEACVVAHADAARRAGAELRFDEPVVRWHARDDSVEVTTARGSYTAGSLVLCAGAWTAELLAELALPLVVERNVLYWFRPSADAARFAADALPIFIVEHARGEMFYGFPLLGDDGVKVARHHSNETCTADAMRRDVTTDDISGMRALLARWMPRANGDLLSAKTCMYTSTPDGHFIIDRHPRHRNVIVASPCSGHGFKFASVIGEILCDLIRDRPTRCPSEMFALRRFSA